MLISSTNHQGITIEQLLNGNYQSHPRTRKIADMFKEAGQIETYGSGIKRIREAFQATGSREPEFAEMGDGFWVRVYCTPQKTPQKQGPTVEKLLDILRKNPSASSREAAELMAFFIEKVAGKKEHGRWIKTCKLRMAYKFTEAPCA